MRFWQIIAGPFDRINNVCTDKVLSIESASIGALHF
jgi:hypothetical protein